MSDIDLFFFIFLIMEFIPKMSLCRFEGLFEKFYTNPYVLYIFLYFYITLRVSKVSSYS